MKTPFTNPRQKRFIDIVMIGLLLIFFYLIRDYIISLVLALIFAALLDPIYRWFLARLKNNRTGSAAFTTIIFLLVIVIPGFLLLQEILRQAVQVTEQILPMIQDALSRGGTQTPELPKWLPFREYLDPYTNEIFDKLSELIGSFSSFIVRSLSNLGQSTALFFLHFFIMIYGIFSFLMDGDKILKMAQKYLPLNRSQFREVTQEIMGVSRATLKGALVIGMIQGALVGLGFWATGLPAALFWAAVSAVASLIPGIGAALVYLPASIYLLVSGQHTAGVGLLVWGFAVVGSIDNILRPKLVGQDMEMSDIMILVSTLGGIALFGIAGIVLGPLIVGLLSVFIKFNYSENSTSK